MQPSQTRFFCDGTFRASREEDFRGVAAPGVLSQTALRHGVARIRVSPAHEQCGPRRQRRTSKSQRGVSRLAARLPGRARPSAPRSLLPVHIVFEQRSHILFPGAGEKERNSGAGPVVAAGLLLYVPRHVRVTVRRSLMPRWEKLRTGRKGRTQRPRPATKARGVRC
jgi:hypothetical protein